MEPHDDYLDRMEQEDADERKRLKKLAEEKEAAEDWNDHLTDEENPLV